MRFRIGRFGEETPDPLDPAEYVGSAGPVVACWDGVHRPQSQCPPPDIGQLVHDFDSVYQEHMRRYREMLEAILGGSYTPNVMIADTGETLPEIWARMPEQSLEDLLASDNTPEPMREVIRQALELKRAEDIPDWTPDPAAEADDDTDEPQTKWWQGPIPIITAIGLGLLALFRRS